MTKPVGPLISTISFYVQAKRIDLCSYGQPQAIILRHDSCEHIRSIQSSKVLVQRDGGYLCVHLCAQTCVDNLIRLLWTVSGSHFWNDWYMYSQCLVQDPNTHGKYKGLKWIGPQGVTPIGPVLAILP